MLESASTLCNVQHPENLSEVVTRKGERFIKDVLHGLGQKGFRAFVAPTLGFAARLLRRRGLPSTSKIEPRGSS